MRLRSELAQALHQPPRREKTPTKRGGRRTPVAPPPPSSACLSTPSGRTIPPSNSSPTPKRTRRSAQSSKPIDNGPVTTTSPHAEKHPRHRSRGALASPPKGGKCERGESPLSQSKSSNRNSPPPQPAPDGSYAISPVSGTLDPSGGRGIRTPGPFRVNGFQDHRLQPLGHPSGDGAAPPSGGASVGTYSGFGKAARICSALVAASLSGSTSIAISRCSAAAVMSPLLR